MAEAITLPAQQSETTGSRRSTGDEALDWRSEGLAPAADSTRPKWDSGLE